MAQQLPMFPPDSSWSATEIFPDLTGSDIISLDCETRDDGIRDNTGPGWATGKGYVTGIAVAWRRGEERGSIYLPYKHAGGGNLDRGRVLKYVQHVASLEAPKVFHNAVYDLGWLGVEGIQVEGPVYDTLFGAPLLDENRKSYSLDALLKDWCGTRKDERLLRDAAKAFNVDPKSDMWKLPAMFVGLYAEADADLTIDLFLEEKKRLEVDKLTDVFELECSLIPLLVEMRRRGIKVDVNKAEGQRVKLLGREKEILSEIARRFGSTDIWANESIAKAFDREGITYPKTAKGAPSFTAEYLGSIINHDLPKLILECRKTNKLLSSFLEGMVLKHGSTGRIHCELHPLRSEEAGTVSGRFSCSNPNLQQVPKAEDEEGSVVRDLFLPEDGCLWGAFDYANQEPRLTVHYAARMKLSGAEEVAQNWCDNDRMDYHQRVADMAGISRKQAKVINLGLAYGMGEVKLCHDLGLPTSVRVDEETGREWPCAGEEGRALLDKYHAMVPYVKELNAKCMDRARQEGRIRTLYGRLCHFDLWEPRHGKGLPLPREEAQVKYGNSIKRAYTYKALNRLIQGSAADMTKLAMRDMWNEGIVPIHTMHDEIDVSAPDEKTARKCAEIMQNCVQLMVPMALDCEFGPSWGTAKEGWKIFNGRN